MSWTDDRVALLKKLWGEGKTAAEIAKELGSVTRNAVIGKAHRLKLSGRASPIQQNKKTPAPKPVVIEKKVKKPAVPIIEEKASENSIPLTDLGPRDCRWPIGDPKDEKFGFCGCSAVAGLPYCMEHAQAAYQPATRNRILKAEERREEEQAIAVMRKKIANQ